MSVAPRPFGSSPAGRPADKPECGANVRKVALRRAPGGRAGGSWRPRHNSGKSGCRRGVGIRFSVETSEADGPAEDAGSEAGKTLPDWPSPLAAGELFRDER